MKTIPSDSSMLEYGLMKPYSNMFCFSTTRHGGCSEGTYESFNCTHYCGDNLERVSANRRLLCSLLPEEPKVLVIPRQTHGVEVREISSYEVSESELDGVLFKYSSMFFPVHPYAAVTIQLDFQLLL